MTPRDFQVGEWASVWFVNGLVATEAGPALVGLVCYGEEPPSDQMIRAWIVKHFPHAQIMEFKVLANLKATAMPEFTANGEMIGRLGLIYTGPDGVEKHKTEEIMPIMGRIT